MEIEAAGISNIYQKNFIPLREITKKIQSCSSYFLSFNELSVLTL